MRTTIPNNTKQYNKTQIVYKLSIKTSLRADNQYKFHTVISIDVRNEMEIKAVYTLQVQWTLGSNVLALLSKTDSR